MGSGHTIKLINNFFAMTTANALAEAFVTADAAGIDRQKLYDVMSAGPLHSGMMDFVKAYAIDGDPNMLAFSIRNAQKDVGYYATMADQAGIPSIMSQSAKMAMSLAVAGGAGDNMIGQMTDFLSELYGAGKS
ncbi:MAG: NAD-binding protein [Rhizobiaceae bacterium]|nr:NAD-binding protein [Rhizobiaceae bacterium]